MIGSPTGCWLHLTTIGGVASRAKGGEGETAFGTRSELEAVKSAFAFAGSSSTFRLGRRATLRCEFEGI